MTSPSRASIALAKRLRQRTSLPGSSPLRPGFLLSSLRSSAGDTIQVVTVTVTVSATDPNLSTWVYTGLALDKNHQLSGARDWLEAQFDENPPSLSPARTVPITMSTTGIPTATVFTRS